MTVRSRTTLKSYFETGDYPSQPQFADFIDSFFHKSEDTIPGNEKKEGVILKDEIVDDKITIAHNLNTLTPQLTLYDQNGYCIWPSNYELRRDPADELNKVIITFFDTVTVNHNYIIKK